MPYSARFYDPILSIIQKDFDIQSRQLFSLQRKYIIERIYEEDFQRKCFEKLGIRNPLHQKSDEIILRYTVINE